MKFLIILLCLASERYLVHAAAEYRKSWIDIYYDFIAKKLLQTKVLINSYVMIAAVILPIVLIAYLLLVLFDNFLFGIFTFFLNLVILYFCLGPENSFYPVTESASEKKSKTDSAAIYFVKVNNQLFAPIFWFIITGSLGVIVYRLLSFCAEKGLTKEPAFQVLSVLDWVTARLTVLLYLLVGNFQKGFHFYTKAFFASPEQNNHLLHEGGLLAAEAKEGESIALPYAQILVEHALVVCLVFLAFFTLVAWL